MSDLFPLHLDLLQHDTGTYDTSKARIFFTNGWYLSSQGTVCRIVPRARLYWIVMRI
jgi:hypothetical protein